MEIEKIVITVRLGKRDKATHATEFTFHDGMWSSNGGVYARLHKGLASIWKVARRVIIEGRIPVDDDGDGPEDTYGKSEFDDDGDDEENDPHFEGTLSR